ncbi:hypothetical protein Trydic_g14496 [Trypoxylus dichotomus]
MPYESLALKHFDRDWDIILAALNLRRRKIQNWPFEGSNTMAIAISIRSPNKAIQFVYDHLPKYALHYTLTISDDDRMSLTTAVSDEDDGESVMNSPYKAKQTGTAAASFNCTGAVRKAG